MTGVIDHPADRATLSPVEPSTEVTDPAPAKGSRVYPVVMPLRMTRLMRERLQAQADRDEIGIQSVIRIGLNRWLASQERKAS